MRRQDIQLLIVIGLIVTFVVGVNVLPGLAGLVALSGIIAVIRAAGVLGVDPVYVAGALLVAFFGSLLLLISIWERRNPRHHRPAPGSTTPGSN